MLLALLAGCHVPPREAPPPPAGAAAPEVPAVPAGPAYRLDPARSELRILVYRAGALARFGHNHVLISRTLGGEVHLAAPGTLAGAGFRVVLPVEGLAIDEPAARREEGDEFASQPTAADIEGTRHNLLGPAVLDAAHCPALVVTGTTAGAPGALRATATVDDCGRAARVEVPLEAGERGGELTVRGGFSLRQSEMGLKPFSVGLGALAVRDELEVRFTLVAVPAG